MPAPATFPRTVTATTWRDALSSLSQRSQKRRGSYADGSPKLTNSEALQLVRAWSQATTRAGWPLWYQFAAVAFGWDPSADTLDTSAAQAARPYPADATAELWVALAGLAAQLDRGDNTAALYTDQEWADPLFAADVRNALVGDGADAQFKIPIPACKDPATGKPVGKPRRDPATGKWRCDPVVVDDPVTHAGRQLGGAAAVILLLWFLLSDNPRRHRRT